MQPDKPGRASQGYCVKKTRMTEENEKNLLKINVFIADEKYAIWIPRNEKQSDEEEIIRRSAKTVTAAIRELEAHQKGIGRMDSLAMVALQLAVNLSKLSDARARRENEIKTALEKLGERWEAEAERIKGHSED